MYLIDTNVISELRRGDNANSGVIEFFSAVKVDNTLCFLSTITLGELQYGVERIRHRGDSTQAETLQTWFDQVRAEFADYIIGIDTDIALLWGRLRVPNYENSIDKFLAATALIHSLTVVTRNTRHLSTLCTAYDPFYQDN